MWCLQYPVSCTVLYTFSLIFIQFDSMLAMLPHVRSYSLAINVTEPLGCLGILPLRLHCSSCFCSSSCLACFVAVLSRYRSLSFLSSWVLSWSVFITYSAVLSYCVFSHSAAVSRFCSCFPALMVFSLSYEAPDHVEVWFCSVRPLSFLLPPSYFLQS